MQTKLLRLFLVALALLSGASSCPAQVDGYANLDRLGEDFSKKLKAQKSRQIAVADLLSGEGTSPDQGHHFAQFLSQSIKRHGKKLQVVDHLKFDEMVRFAQIPAGAFASPAMAAAFAPKIPEDILVIGTVQRDESHYLFQIAAVRMSDGKALASGTASFARTEFIDSLSEPFPPKFDFPVVKFNAKAGMRSPKCVYCPEPSYSDRARADRLQGTVVFETVVSQAGYIVAVHPTKLIGDGLDERAFETIRSWKLRPATDGAGNPIAVQVPIEVTFRLY